MVVSALYVVASTVFSVLAILGPSVEFGAMVNAIQVAIGLLLLAVWSATSLAEERARGSLDLLMCTPLSTRQVVIGKWLGAFRAAPLLALLPSFVVGSSAYIADRNPIGPAGCMFIHVLCAGACVTSLGILMATWFSRLGRAVAATVTVYALATLGWQFLISNSSAAGPGALGLSMGSPFYWTAVMTYEFGRRQIAEFTDWAIFWIGVDVVLAGAMLGCAIRGFDRHLGRVEERPRDHVVPGRRRTPSARGASETHTTLEHGSRRRQVAAVRTLSTGG
jgi:ABC-type transport system involved in multi-copper enzyme maturation permease subunit